MSQWNGDEWRWWPRMHTPARSYTIAVIEVPARAEPEGQVHRVPFGFGVREPEPLLWEGDDG